MALTAQSATIRRVKLGLSNPVKPGRETAIRLAFAAAIASVEEANAAQDASMLERARTLEARARQDRKLARKHGGHAGLISAARTSERNARALRAAVKDRRACR